MGEFAKKEELIELREEMYKGFDKINGAIDNLVKNTNQNFRDLTDNLTTFVSKSKDGDSSVRNELMREIEIKEKERRSSNLKTFTVILSLITLIWGAIWWGININDDKKRSDDKLEVCRKMHELEIESLKRHYNLKIRIQKLEATE